MYEISIGLATRFLSESFEHKVAHTALTMRAISSIDHETEMKMPAMLAPNRRYLDPSIPQETHQNHLGNLHAEPLLRKDMLRSIRMQRTLINMVREKCDKNPRPSKGKVVCAPFRYQASLDTRR